MSAPEFVELPLDYAERVTINPRSVARVERVTSYAGPDSARIVLHSGKEYVVSWSYEYALQQVCGIFR